jgi:general stress protein CsbA
MPRAALFVAVWFGCIAVGYFVPMQFDRDVGGALAAAILMVAGAIIGPFVALFIVRRLPPPSS